MNWKYCLVKRIHNSKYLHDPEILYEIREATLSDEGEITGISSMPDIIGHSVEEVENILKSMLDSCKKDIICYDTLKVVNEHPHPVDRGC